MKREVSQFWETFILGFILGVLALALLKALAFALDSPATWRSLN